MKTREAGPKDVLLGNGAATYPGSVAFREFLRSDRWVDLRSKTDKKTQWKEVWMNKALAALEENGFRFFERAKGSERVKADFAEWVEVHARKVKRRKVAQFFRDERKAHRAVQNRKKAKREYHYNLKPEERKALNIDDATPNKKVDLTEESSDSDDSSSVDEQASEDVIEKSVPKAAAPVPPVSAPVPILPTDVPIELNVAIAPASRPEMSLIPQPTPQDLLHQALHRIERLEYLIMGQGQTIKRLEQQLDTLSRESLAAATLSRLSDVRNEGGK